MKDRLSFNHDVERVLSNDPETFEEGFWSLIETAPAHVHELVMLMQAQSDAFQRAKFVELLGATRSRDVIPVLAAELRHPEHQVRQWALLSLDALGFPEAREIAAAYRAEHRDEWP